MASGPAPAANIGGYSIAVRTAGGQESAAGLIALARGQAGFVVPEGLPDGPATVILRREHSTVATGEIRIARVSPGIFTANSSGEGAPAGQALYVDRTGRQRLENLFERFTGATVRARRIDAAPRET
jgi:uncharacterized protein (TIGR03437 family)